MSRVIVIGDVHGCYDELVELLDICQATQSDRIIFTGDLIDRGPANDKCVDLVMQIEAKQNSPACVLGNHEEKHLYYRDTERSGELLKIKSQSHIKTREQLSDIHYKYFESLPLYIRLPEYNSVVVHAGVFPGRKIEEQTKRHLLHIQMINPIVKDDGTINEKSLWPSRAPYDEGWKFWTNFWNGEERIIFGHSSFDKPLVTDKVVGIDGGCCYGRELRAFLLPDNKIVSVKSRSKYKDNIDVAKYPIQNGVMAFS